MPAPFLARVLVAAFRKSKSHFADPEAFALAKAAVSYYVKYVGDQDHAIRDLTTYVTERSSHEETIAIFRFCATVLTAVKVARVVTGTEPKSIFMVSSEKIQALASRDGLSTNVLNDAQVASVVTGTDPKKMIIVPAENLQYSPTFHNCSTSSATSLSMPMSVAPLSSQTNGLQVTPTAMTTVALQALSTQCQTSTSAMESRIKLKFEKTKHDLVLLAYMTENPDKNVRAQAFELFCQEADNNNSWAQYALALIYKNGFLDQKQDSQKTITWCEKAASNGNSIAQFELGYIYEMGLSDGKPDPVKASVWYTMAAKQQNSSAIKRLNAIKNGKSSFSEKSQDSRMQQEDGEKTQQKPATLQEEHIESSQEKIDKVDAKESYANYAIWSSLMDS